MNSFFSIYSQNKAWIKFAVKCFAVAMVLGAVAYVLRPELINQIIEIFKSKFGTEPVPNSNLALEIFIQNTNACLIALFGGLLFGISSFLIVFFNGFIIGFVVLLLLTASGSPVHNLAYVILGLLPHGIFELPAFFLASAIGMRLGLEWLRPDSRGQRIEVLRTNITRAIYSLPVLILLLVVAAFIEVFVSGKFVNNF